MTSVSYRTFCILAFNSASFLATLSDSGVSPLAVVESERLKHLQGGLHLKFTGAFCVALGRVTRYLECTNSSHGMNEELALLLKSEVLQLHTVVGGFDVPSLIVTDFGEVVSLGLLSTVNLAHRSVDKKLTFVLGLNFEQTHGPGGRSTGAE